MSASDILTQLEELAAGCGFTQTGILDAATIMVRQEVRDACAADKCNAYGKNWSCPPAIGSLEECAQQIGLHQAGLILQTTGSMEDAFDYESISRIAKEHEMHIQAFQEKLASFFAPDWPWLLLGAGGCKTCEECTCPHSPCRFPDKMIVSMEAMGIFVSELCKLNNIPYYYGPNTLTYVGCLLIL